MTLTMYLYPACANCRVAFMSARALKVDFKIVWVTLDEKGTKSPEFLKMNPLHTVPTLDDDGFILTESRAISLYLAEQYSKDERLYPKDPKTRAKVQSFLFYDVGAVYQNIRNYAYPQFIPGWPMKIGPKTLSTLHDQLDKLEKHCLAESDFLFGDNMTLADLSLCASVTLLQPFDFDFKPWPRLGAWLDRMRALPFFSECNQPGFDEMLEMKKVVDKMNKE